MEVDELGDFSFGGGIVVFDALFDTETSEQLANFKPKLAFSFTFHNGGSYIVLFLVSISLDFNPLYKSLIPNRT